MPGELRARVIRLAHERPELRPHLLPLLARTTRQKEAWSRIPKGFVSFGFRGDRAEAAGNEMTVAVTDVIRQMKDQARTTWKRLASELMSNKEVDVDPGLSREAISAALRDTYSELSKKADAYFESLP